MDYEFKLAGSVAAIFVAHKRKGLQKIIQKYNGSRAGRTRRKI
jgi:hypothetical protein